MAVNLLKNIIRNKNLIFQRLFNCVNLQNKTSTPIRVSTKTKIKPRVNFYAHIRIKADIKKGSFSLLIVNRFENTINRISGSSEQFIKANDIYKIFILIEPNSSISINIFDFEYIENIDYLYSKFKKDSLLISPGYPSDFFKYAYAFVHSRIVGYKKYGFYVDTIVANKYNLENISFYEFEGERVCVANYLFLRTLLLKKIYKKILVHFIEIPILKILENVNTLNTQIFLYSHGVDTTYRDYKILHASYQRKVFSENDFPLTFSLRDELITKFNLKPNVIFVFGSNWCKNRAEKLIKIKFNNTAIVPCFVDDELFTYTKPNDNLRKKILIIRPQENLSTYSLDICVRVILELSRKPYFNDLSFAVYGTGSQHDWLVKPLKQFKNVKIVNRFLAHSEMSTVYKKYGICLIPSRYDTQCVVACEAAMSGKLVISSHGTGLKEYIDEKFGLYCETENIEEYVNKIESLYNDSKTFINLSKKIHDFAYKTCSKKYSIEKDLNLIKKFNNKQNLSIPSLVDNPILTVCIPAYNVSKFIIQTLAKFLECSNASEIEVLIINDGSTDSTSNIVKRFISTNYKENKKPIFKIVDKENGGHGSTINAAIKIAKGKYFRVLDGDDYFVSSKLDNLIEQLKKENVDAVLNEYIEDNGFFGTVKKTDNIFLLPNVVYKVDDCCFDNYGFSGDMRIGFQLHSISIKTDVLRSANFSIDENCYHDDVEYDFICLVLSNTLKYCPSHIYNYVLGNPNQSMSPLSIKKHLHMHAKVTLRIVQEYYNFNLTEGKKTLIENRLVPLLCNFQYYNMIRFKNSKLFKSFDKKLSKFPDFYNSKFYVNKYIMFYRKFPFLINFDTQLYSIWLFCNKHLFFRPIVKFLKRLFSPK